MNNKQLQKEIQRLEVDANEADRMHKFDLANALALEGEDDVKATMLHQSAQHHEQKAKEYNDRLSKCRDQLSRQEQEAAGLHQELDREQAQHDAKVADLRKRIDNLEGASLF